jgi:hypothetical protein
VIVNIVIKIVFEIRGSHGGEGIDDGLLGCDTMPFVGGYQRFASIFTQKMDAIRSSESLVTTYTTTRCHNPDHHRQNCFWNIFSWLIDTVYQTNYLQIFFSSLWYDFQ